MLLAYFRESREGNFNIRVSWSANFLVREPFSGPLVRPLLLIIKLIYGTKGIPPLSNMDLRALADAVELNIN